MKSYTFAFASVLSLLVASASAKGRLAALSSGHPAIAAWRRRAQQGTIDPSTMLPTEGDPTSLPTSFPAVETAPPTAPVLVETAPPSAMDSMATTAPVIPAAGTVPPTAVASNETTAVPGTSPPVDAPDPVGGAAKFCYMVFQMADNNLEFFIRQDLYEMTISPAVQDPSFATWIYFDALNFGSPDYVDGPLENVFNADGTAITEKFEGSQYLRWDHAQGKMVVDTRLTEEQDSDVGSVLQAFLQTALTDCVALGTQEYILVLSSHGGGYAGFGADDNFRRRSLSYQTNDSILNAITTALGSVAGAPDKLDVLGFDACLMQSVGALDEYNNITKYYIASEATEPGHGWAYNELTVPDTALDFALNAHTTFLNSPQGPEQQAPKTLAVVDTEAFLVFFQAWEALCAEFVAIIQSNDDPDFYANLGRARSSAISFSGSLDDPTVKVNAGMDIGSFLQIFKSFCNPDASSQLGALLDSTQAAYESMFTATGVGPGTPQATGMHISFVTKQEYKDYTPYYEPMVFSETNPPIRGAPNYLAFLRAYYESTTPPEGASDSACLLSLVADRSATSDTELLIDPVFNLIAVDQAELISQVTRNTDFVFVEYGIDISNLLSEDAGRRLRETVLQRSNRKKNSNGNGGRRSRRVAYGHRKRERRTQEADDDYFIIYGGDIRLDYEGPNIVAVWDRTYFLLEYLESVEPLYVFDDGDGAKSIPVCYFPPSIPITPNQIPIGITVDDAIANLGCLEGYLTFSLAPDSNAGISLYVWQDGTLSETREESMGQIVPIFYADIVVEGNSVDELLGGFDSTIIPWDPTSEFTIYFTDDVTYAGFFETSLAFVEAFAYDDDTSVIDDRIFTYTVDGGAPDDEAPTGAPNNESPAESPTGAPNGEPSSSPGHFGGWLSLMLVVSFLVPCVVLTMA